MFKFLVETDEQSIKLQKFLFKCDITCSSLLCGRYFRNLCKDKYGDSPFFICVEGKRWFHAPVCHYKYTCIDYKLLTLDWLECFDDDGDYKGNADECAGFNNDILKILSSYTGKRPTAPFPHIDCSGYWNATAARDKYLKNKPKPLKPVNEKCVLKECLFWSEVYGDITGILIGYLPSRHVPYRALIRDNKLFSRNAYGYCGDTGFSVAKRCPDIKYGDEDE